MTAFAGEYATQADVHKTHAENVWLGSVSADPAHTVSATFAIPSATGDVRFVELMEVQRQVGMLQLHRQMNVDPDDVLVLTEICLNTVSTSTRPGDRPRHGVVRAHLVDTSGQPRGERRISQYFSIETARGLAAVGRSVVMVLPRALYDRLRRRSNGSTPNVERSLPTDASPLQIDWSDPLTSDHESDHITAMQLAASVERHVMSSPVQTDVRSMTLNFDGYAERVPTPVLHISPVDDNTIHGSVKQRGITRTRFSVGVTSRHVGIQGV